MVLNDKQIREIGAQDYINPFHPNQVRQLENGYKIVSYGVSSYGYDVTLSSDFTYFEPYSGIFDIHSDVNKPKSIEVEQAKYILTPGEMVLGRTFEYIKMPRNCLALCVTKSTWARQGLFVNTTPIEPGWHGYITLELSNVGNCPIALYAFEGIAQLVYLTGEEPEQSYADRNGKYQGQRKVTQAKL